MLISLSVSLQEGLPDSSDDFQDFRFRAIEVVQDTVFIVGYTTCFLEVRSPFLTMIWHRSSLDFSGTAPT